VGTLGLASHNDSKPMQAGFQASLHYTDGFGQAVKPNTGQMAVFTNEPWTMNHAMLVGLQLDVGGMERGEGVFRSPSSQDGRLYEMFANGTRVTEQQLQGVEDKARAYRAKLRTAFTTKEAILPSSFWYMVYANDGLTKEGLAAWLASDHVGADGDGKAGEIFDIMSAHEQGLNYLFVRMSLARINEVAALWIGFFDNLWSNNKHITEVAANAVLLDPKQRTALAYKPMNRAALETALGACSPSVLTSGGSSKLICPALLNALYAELEKRSRSPLAWAGARSNQVVPVWVTPVQVVVVQQQQQQQQQQHMQMQQMQMQHMQMQRQQQQQQQQQAQMPPPIKFGETASAIDAVLAPNETEWGSDGSESEEG